MILQFANAIVGFVEERNAGDAVQTLKRFKDEVNEVQAGQECGMAFQNFQDLKAGDQIECFTVETIQRTL
jgi:translation initiation factor IF-2